MQVRKLLAALCAAAVVTCGASIASGAPGDLDPGFNGTGKRVIDFGGNDTVNAMVVQPDGKIVVVGSGPSDTFTITRLNPDGSVDTGFGGSGTGTFRFNFGHPAIARAVALAPDGKIVVAGKVSSTPDNDDAAVARLNPDGTPDTTFSATGWRTADFGGDDDVAVGVAVLPDGKLILAGQGSPNRRLVIARLTPKIYDSTFAGGGITTVAIANGVDASAMAIAPDGKIVVIGTAYVSGTGADFAIARLNADGTPDDSFDGDGQKTIDLGGTDEPLGLAVTPDGKMLIAGHSSLDNFALVRLGSTGSPDLTFNGDGTLRIAFGTGDTVAHAVALQPDGRIVLAGRAELGWGFARVLPGGALDTTFGDNGRRVVLFNSKSTDEARAVGLEPDGGIVAGGDSRNASNLDLAVVKLQGDGTGSSPGGPDGAGGPGGSGGSGASLKCGGKRATVVGTNGRDRLKGGRRADVIVGLGGNDTITGLGGNDVICGGNGNDKLSGGAGRDKVYGQAGKDSLTGGSGNDSLSGGAGKDKLSGGAGKDKLSGGAGKDKLSGGAGKDRCTGHDRKSSC